MEHEIINFQFWIQ